METAKPIAARLGLRVRVERGPARVRLRRLDGREALRPCAGGASGATVQSFPSSFRFPDGESFVEMQARMVSALDRLADRHRGETFVAVSHADPIKAAVAATAGVPLDLFQRLVVSPCSVTGLVRGATRLLRAVRQRHGLAGTELAVS